MFPLKGKGMEMNDEVLTLLCRIETTLSLLEPLLSRRDDDILVSCTEASRLLGKTKTTISMMIREKRLNKVTIGGSTGIRLSEILKMNTQ